MKWENKKTDALVSVCFVGLIWLLFSVVSLLRYETGEVAGKEKWIGIRQQADRILNVKDADGIYLGSGQELFRQYLPQDYEPREKDTENRLMQLAEAYPEAVFFLLPTKEAVYPDKLPAFAPNYDQERLLLSLQEKMEPQQYADLLSLWKEKRGEALYYRTDEHLTTRGTLYLYEVWLQKTGYYPRFYSLDNKMVIRSEFLGDLYREEFGTVSADTLTVLTGTVKKSPIVFYDAEENREGLYVKTRLQSEDPYGYFLDGSHAKTEIVTGYQAGGRQLILIKDSYANELVPLLLPHYRKMYILDAEVYDGNIMQYIENHADEKTDIMVIGSIMGFFPDGENHDR